MRYYAVDPVRRNTNPDKKTPGIFSNANAYFGLELSDIYHLRYDFKAYIPNTDTAEDASIMAYGDNGQLCLNRLYDATNGYRMQYVTPKPSNVLITDSIVFNDWNDISINNNNITVNGVLYSGSSSTETVNDLVGIFVAHKSGPRRWQAPCPPGTGIAGIKIYRNEVLENDLIPINMVKEGGTTKEGAFYDLINKTYHFSMTSVPFVYSEM